MTGLRVGEALRLRPGDVDLDTGVLTVRGTKFGKSRLVPIHASTRDVLAGYSTRRASHLCGDESTHFFITRTGHQLDGGDVRRTFYSLSRQIGLRGADASHGPRLHDFRHNSEAGIIPSAAPNDAALSEVTDWAGSNRCSELSEALQEIHDAVAGSVDSGAYLFDDIDATRPRWSCFRLEWSAA